MKKLYVILGMFLCVSVSAQVIVSERTEMRYERQVFGAGVSVGPIGGAGISFRHHLPSPFSYTLTGGIIKVDNTLSFAVGTELQYDLARSTNGRYYVLVAFSYYYNGSAQTNNLKGPFHTGLGMGAEFAANGPLHVSIEGAFTYFSDGTILPLPQLGIHYYFY